MTVGPDRLHPNIRLLGNRVPCHRFVVLHHSKGSTLSAPHAPLSTSEGVTITIIVIAAAIATVTATTTAVESAIIDIVVETVSRCTVMATGRPQEVVATQFRRRKEESELSHGIDRDPSRLQSILNQTLRNKQMQGVAEFPKQQKIRGLLQRSESGLSPILGLKRSRKSQ